MEIVPFARAHRDEVAALWRVVFGYADRRNDPFVSMDKKAAHTDGLFFVALEDARVVGTIMAGYDGHRGWIYSLAVDSRVRRRGIGAALLKHAEAKLTGLGCMKINLQLVSSNSAVAAFYEAHGYCVEARISMGKSIEANIPARPPGCAEPQA